MRKFITPLIGDYCKFETTFMKKIIFTFPVFILFLFLSCRSGDREFALQKGDLLFSVGKSNSELLRAIQTSTGKDKNISFTHVGIATIQDGEIYVIEATSPEGVVKTPLKKFIDDAGVLHGKPLIAVGRLKEEHRYILHRSIENAETFLGKPYDYAYNEKNDAYYCSELVRFSFLDSLGIPLFEPLAMSFKDPHTGETAAYWIKHYAKLGKPVPKGHRGTNPDEMSRSTLLDIVYTYYTRP